MGKQAHIYFQFQQNIPQANILHIELKIGKLFFCFNSKLTSKSGTANIDVTLYGITRSYAKFNLFLTRDDQIKFL